MNMVRALSVLGIGMAAGCITVNISFPPREVEKAAEVIVGEARPAEGAVGADPARVPDATEIPAPATAGDSAPPPGGGAEDLPAEKKDASPKAPDPKINIDSPEIRAIRGSLNGRFRKLEPFYGKGAIGEGREGFLEGRDDAALSLKEKRDVKALLDEENKDRRNLYQEIVKLNRFGPERLKDIQRIFAIQWADKSRPGWWVQTPEGKWEKKAPPQKGKGKKTE